jgi:hypothetical protein
MTKSSGSCRPVPLICCGKSASSKWASTTPDRPNVFGKIAMFSHMHIWQNVLVPDALRDHGCCLTQRLTCIRCNVKRIQKHPFSRCRISGMTRVGTNRVRGITNGRPVSLHGRILCLCIFRRRGFLAMRTRSLIFSGYPDHGKLEIRKIAHCQSQRLLHTNWMPSLDPVP